MSLRPGLRNWFLKYITQRGLLLVGTQLFLLFGLMQGSAASFQNLNFEGATFTPGPPYARSVASTAAMPGWTVFSGSTPASSVTYDGLALDSWTVAILDANALYDVLPQAFQGRFTVVLQGGFSVYPSERGAVSIAQTAVVPASAKSLLFDAAFQIPGRTNFVVSIAGESLPFHPVEHHTNFVVYAADVSRFAGQNVELRFTSYPRLSPELAVYSVYLDDIRFSEGMGGSDFVYATQDGAITITGYGGPGGSVVIPTTIDGLPVIGIGTGAFYECYALGDIIIPNTVTNIGASAFENCLNLLSVNIPSGVTTIAASTFAGCDMLFSVSIPTGVTSIEDSAFRGTGLCNVTMPASIVSIGNSAFQSCFGLTSVSIPASVTNVGDQAFAYSGLRDISIPASITSLSNGVFSGCTSLTNVTIPYNLRSIGNSAFFGTGLLQLNLPDGLTSIGTSAFAYCAALSQLKLPNGLARLGAQAFDMCRSLTNVTIPNSLASVPGGAFNDCSSLENVTLPNRLMSIGSSAFNGCRVMNVVIPQTVTNIGDWAFANCAYLTNITLPESLLNIGSWCFAWCSSLTNATIPGSVLSIGDGAFRISTNLTGVFFTGNPPSLGGPEVFYRDTNATVYYFPGTTGWGPTFGGRPTVLYNAVIQTVAPDFGVHANRFGFSIAGTPNIPVLVEGSVSVVNSAWLPMLSCNLTNGSVAFSDPDWAHFSARFYRLRWP